MEIIQVVVRIATTTNNDKGAAIIMVTGGDATKGVRFYVLASMREMPRVICTREANAMSRASTTAQRSLLSASPDSHNSPKNTTVMREFASMQNKGLKGSWHGANTS